MSERQASLRYLFHISNRLRNRRLNTVLGLGHMADFSFDSSNFQLKLPL